MLIHKPFSEISDGESGWLMAKHHFALGPYGNPEHRFGTEEYPPMPSRSLPKNR